MLQIDCVGLRQAIGSLKTHCTFHSGNDITINLGPAQVSIDFSLISTAVVLREAEIILEKLIDNFISTITVHHNFPRDGIEV